MHRWCLHGPFNSYYSFWWNNLILCRYNVDTLNICMEEFGSQKVILTKWQLWELRQLFPYTAFVYALIVPLWALKSYHSFWWSNLILCQYNVDTMNIYMKEFIIFVELRQLSPYMAFVYAWIVPLWADQLLLQLLMEQFDTLLIQCRHIEHMYEGVYNFCLHRFNWNLLIKTKVFLFEL